MAETVALTMGELDRLQVMSQLAERRLTRRRAAALLGLSERQVRRLYRAFRRDGAKALASRHRGRPSNRQLATATREQALTLVRERYVDFGPTFAHQKLTEQHGLGEIGCDGALTPEEQAHEAAFQEKRARTLRDPRFRRWLREATEKAGIWEFAYRLEVGRRCAIRDG